VRESFGNALENALHSEAGRSMFRAMRSEPDGLPKVERSARGLGVRIEGTIRDIVAAQDGTVEPGTGGMSVALDAALNLPKPRLPRSLGGEGRDAVFTILAADVPLTLLLRPDRHPARFRRARPPMPPL